MFATEVYQKQNKQNNRIMALNSISYLLNRFHVQQQGTAFEPKLQQELVASIGIRPMPSCSNFLKNNSSQTIK